MGFGSIWHWVIVLLIVVLLFGSGLFCLTSLFFGTRGGYYDGSGATRVVSFAPSSSEPK